MHFPDTDRPVAELMAVAALFAKFFSRAYVPADLSQRIHLTYTARRTRKISAFYSAEKANQVYARGAGIDAGSLVAVLTVFCNTHCRCLVDWLCRIR